MDNSPHGLLNTICNNKSLADSPKSSKMAKFTLKKLSSGMELPRVVSQSLELSFDPTCFLSRRLCNIDHRFTTAYHPQTNGLPERFNKTLVDMFSMYVDVEQKKLG
ncbi:hypothetical protein TNCV_3995271 [Trichonephila clavipes]|nr:hypothetical protein TNCV_3995271 [Trichonephila clavipes]